MKSSPLNRLALMAFAVSCVLPYAVAYSHEGRGSTRGDWLHEARHPEHAAHGFYLGICVGEALAQQGIRFTDLQPGNESDAVLAELRQAEQDCRNQWPGGPTSSPNPSPSPSPSSSPDPSPSGNPIPGTSDGTVMNSG